MKLVRHFHTLQGQPDRNVIVGLKGGYHGLTFGAFALTGDDLGQRVYGVDQRLVRHVTPNSAEQLRDLLSREGRRVAAIFVEPVLGSGTVPLTDEYVDELLRLRDEYGFLLVADEVATGFGRTGEFIASHRWSASPDLVLLSKGLTNGTCAAATIVVSHAVTATFARYDSILVHAETQGGTAVTCAAILATLAELDRLDGLANARKLAAQLNSALSDPAALHPSVYATTGIGCFRTLLVRTPNGRDLAPSDVAGLVAAIRDAGAIVHPGPSGIQLAPALTYGDNELAELLGCVRDGLSAFANLLTQPRCGAI